MLRIEIAGREYSLNMEEFEKMFLNRESLSPVVISDVY